MEIQRLTSKVKDEIKQERFRFLTPLGLLILLIVIVIIFVFIFKLQQSNNEKVLFDATDASTELYLENSVKTNPENTSAKITLAMIYVKRGNLTAAETLINDAEKHINEHNALDIKKAKYEILRKKLALAPYASPSAITAANTLIALSKDIYGQNPPKTEKDRLKEWLCLVGKSNEAVAMIKAECGKDMSCLAQLDKIAKNSLAHGAYRDASNIYAELSTLSTDKKEKAAYILKATDVLISANLPKEALNTLVSHKTEVWNDELALKAVNLARANNMTELASQIMSEYLNGGY